ncbi:MAG TPA: MtrB/PioB family outer membrane beta-barrel protein, partial [Terriglobales bacterium]|nr:MtrB/PioB family outer membrane beta-barrel protein [Terriglobales bacterium]
MKTYKLLAISTLLALLLVPAAVAQEQAAPERGVVEFGFRGVTGEVYGRTFPASTALPGTSFSPNLSDSPLNVYSDYRNAFYVPKVNVHLDNFLGSNSYLRLQSASNGFAFQDGGSLSRDQSVLVTLGQYGHYKAQFRFDETPHVFSGTTRTLFSGGNGTWNIDPALQSKLFNTLCGGVLTTGGATKVGKCSTSSLSTSALVALNSTNISNAVAGGLVGGVSGVQPFTQEENRKAITGLMSWNLNPNVSLSGLFSREHQVGTRPIGFVMGSSSTGYIAETPESIDYYTNTVKFTSEFGQKHWDASLGYQGSFFQNNIPNMLVMNPFSTVYDAGITASNPNGNTTGMGPATGRMDLYPDNKYQQFVGQGAVDLGKNIHLMVNVTPGWMSQTASFQPLTTNPYLSAQNPPAGYPSFVPASNLGGKVDTLAMNYTGVFKATKSLVFVAKYLYYNYDNQTPDLLMRPTVADTIFLTSGSFHGSTAGCYDPVVGPSSENVINSNYTYYCPGEQTSFTSKLFDVGGTWFFTKKNSVKFGYQRGWMDRTGREVEESIEDSVYGALDMHLRKHLLLRVSGRHQNRLPQGGASAYELDTGNVYARMPDQATRVRNRGDASLQWDATQK